MILTGKNQSNIGEQPVSVPDLLTLIN